uniref:Proteasome alpha-type subunits domain-containing protein n=1 Tax=Phaeomonas parva TaxID=124430 RepID=A0A6U4IHJ6_9STRA|mmetsp:Transcript_40353/g.126219  ORF Transcript_40353/g.126219 Transcript_40353/m.126219 type:complete len:250 (+) Transcript_40353:108-857(+)
MAQGRESNYDHHISIFSPQGHLYQVEYCMKSANSTGLTTIAIRGADSTAFVTQKKVPDRLIDPTSVSNVYTITPKVGVVVTGQPADARAQVARIRQEAHEFKFSNGFDMPVYLLAKRVADLSQLRTQRAGMRLLACFTTIIGVDDEKGPQLYQVDPAGMFFPFKAFAAGAKKDEANNWLERHVEEFPAMSSEDIIRQAIICLQHVLSADFRGTEIEVGVVQGENRFTTLSPEEIEAHLSAISEQDMDGA